MENISMTFNSCCLAETADQRYTKHGASSLSFKLQHLVSSSFHQPSKQSWDLSRGPMLQPHTTSHARNANAGNRSAHVCGPAITAASGGYLIFVNSVRENHLLVASPQKKPRSYRGRERRSNLVRRSAKDKPNSLLPMD